MKEITVINGNIVREDSNFFKAVQCRPRNPKARCENCAFDDCSNLEFSDPVFCNASEQLDNTNIVWRPMTREETLNEIQKRKNLVAEYQQLLESAKKAGEEAKYADDIVSCSKIIRDIERSINIYKSELEKME